MPEDVIKTTPESQDPSALQTAVYSYTHPVLGAIKYQRDIRPSPVSSVPS